MLWTKPRSNVPAILFIAAASISTTSLANSERLTAGVILTKLSQEERFSYVAGVVEGLAYARYFAEGKTTESLDCIFNWFYREDGTTEKIYAAFDRYPNQPAGALIAVLIRTKCGG